MACRNHVVCTSIKQLSLQGFSYDILHLSGSQTVSSREGRHDLNFQGGNVITLLLFRAGNCYCPAVTKIYGEECYGCKKMFTNYIE